MTRPQLPRHSYGALALITSVALAACTPGGSSSSSSTVPSASTIASASVEPSASASEPASGEPSGTASATASAEPSESLGPFACAPSMTVPATVTRAQITDVRVGTHTGYDRVTFEFASGIPQTVIEGVLPPFYADPSDLPIDIAGTAFLKVTMNGGTRFSDGGLTYAGSINFQPGFPQLVQLREGGDFEALSTWYLGLDGGGCIRVMTLTAPSRLVIDIEH
jgi:hypothetical protein